MGQDNRLERYTLVGEASALLLRAISHEGPEAVAAFRRWRSLASVEDAGSGARRVVPLLVDLVRREGLTDPDIDRMRGVSRHIWTQNSLNVRVLLAALDALASAGLRPMLLKGLALFVRSPEFMGKRSSTDGDILVRLEELERAAGLLRRHGFEPKANHWEDFAAPLIESSTSGASLLQPGQRSPLDLHWRPLSNICDPGLAETLFARAEERELHGRPILLPTVTDQLFLALARCEPWEEEESLARLVEARLLLSVHAQDVDWPALALLVSRYGLEATAYAFLGDLARYAGLHVPETFLTRLTPGPSGEKWTEWGIRTLPPDRRSERQRWELQRMDELHHRGRDRLPLPTLREIRLRRLGLNAATAGVLWQALRERMRRGEVRDIQFLEGFTYPEKEGRWSTGHWSALAIPLSLEQQAGEPVRLNIQAFLGRGERAKIVAHGGRGTVRRVQARSDAGIATLDLAVRPLPELGGAGLILLWTPHAQTPFSAGLSDDRRELGLFVRRAWKLPGRSRRTSSRTVYGRLRDAYRHLPLPLAVRSRLSPVLGSVQGRIAVRSVPSRTPEESIKRGDVVLSAFLSDLSGIGRAGRLTRDWLLTWGVPLVQHDIREDPSADWVRDVGSGGVWICHCNAPEAVAVLLGGTERLWASRYRIGVWAYELGQLPADWVSALGYFHEIWAPSQFVADAILRSRGPSGPVIRVVPHPIPLLPLPRDGRPSRPGRPFTFLSMFDTRSTSARKNPMGAIRAFQRAFEPTSHEAALLIKVAHGEADASALRDLNKVIAGWPNISLMTKHLSDQETLALIASADCLVSLHRSEGFGLPIAEAMSVGTPSIITGWSAPVEFSKGAAVEIGYELVPVSDNSGRYEGPGHFWADPDVNHAAREMRMLVSDPHRWAALSSAGLDIVRNHLSQPIAPASCRRFLMASGEQAVGGEYV